MSLTLVQTIAVESKAIMYHELGLTPEERQLYVKKRTAEDIKMSKIKRIKMLSMPVSDS